MTTTETHNKVKKFTPEIWQKILGVTIHDADGWDRSSPTAFETSWNTPIGFVEFKERFMKSTTSAPNKEKWKNVDEKVAQNIFLVEQHKRLIDIHKELHDIANSLAGNDTGFIAACIHQAAGSLKDPRDYLYQRIKNGETPEAAGHQAMMTFAMNQMKSILPPRVENCPDCGLPCDDPRCCYYDEDLNK